MSGWIGVDLDGTLAYYDKWCGAETIGPPIPLMLERVKNWISQGIEVRIFTARIDGAITKTAKELIKHNQEFKTFEDVEFVKQVIEQWCLKYIGRVIPITNSKDLEMIELWDDRCVRVEKNTGRIL